MINDLFCAAYHGLQTLFNQWFWGYLFIPFYLSVLGGTIGANLGVYREIQRKAFEEIRSIRRRIFPKTREKTRDDWINCRVDVATAYIEIANDFDYRRFVGAANNFKATITELSREFDRTDEAVWEIAMRGADVAGDYDSLNRTTAYDAGMRARMRKYIDENHREMCMRVLNQKPDWGAVMDMPGLARLCHKFAKCLKRK